MKLGIRLQKIKEMVNGYPDEKKLGFDEIWDCCCDHGHLGFALLNEKLASKVHFVDVVASLTDKVKQDLNQFYKGDPTQWEVHCIDVAKLPINVNDQKKHLVIIAGIGGELMIELLKPLFNRMKIEQATNIEFILSPVHHNLVLRQFLIQQDYLMINEQLTFENNRGYEVLHIGLQGKFKITLTGNLMWDLNDKKHLQHLEKTVQHYQRKGDELAVKYYQNLLES